MTSPCSGKFLGLLRASCALGVDVVARRLCLPRRFAAFLCVGALNTLVGYLLYSFFVFIGCNYIFAPLFSTLLGVLFNFKTIGAWVFKSRDNKLIGRFFAVYAIVYALNVAGLKAFAAWGVANLYLAGLALALPLALLSFALNKKYVFVSSRED